MTRRRVHTAGFTLLEIMLAITIMSFITVIIWASTSQMGKIKLKVEAAQDRTHSARVALMRMTREIEMAFLSLSENTALQERRTLFISAPGQEVDELRFSWFGRQRLRADSAESDTSLVSYYGEPDPLDRRVVNLMRRETRRLEAKDPLTIPGEAYILCPNVAKVKFSFYDFRKKEWREDWNTMGATGLQYLPTHVRIYLTVVDERGQEVVYSSASRIQLTERVDYRPRKS